MFERSSVFYLQLLVIKVKLHRSPRSAGKALHPGEPRAKSRIEVFECIYIYLCVCEPYSSCAPIFQYVQCTLSVAHSGTFLKISCHKSFWLYIIIWKYFEKVRSQLALQAIVRISISISFGPLWGWDDLLPTQQQHKQTSRMTWLERDGTSIFLRLTDKTSGWTWPKHPLPNYITGA